MNEFEMLPQYEHGKFVEAYLDGFFQERGYGIRQTTPAEERQHCFGDRYFTKNGISFYVEYKSGIQTHYTGNIFLETISVDDPTSFREGWVYTCNADWLIYATILDGCLLVFKPSKLRMMIGELKKQFKEVATSKNQNNGYNTHGIIVPLEYAKTNLASKIIWINERTKNAKRTQDPSRLYR